MLVSFLNQGSFSDCGAVLAAGVRSGGKPPFSIFESQE